MGEYPLQKLASQWPAPSARIARYTYIRTTGSVICDKNLGQSIQVDHTAAAIAAGDLDATGRNPPTVGLRMPERTQAFPV